MCVRFSGCTFGEVIWRSSPIEHCAHGDDVRTLQCWRSPAWRCQQQYQSAGPSLWLSAACRTKAKLFTAFGEKKKMHHASCFMALTGSRHAPVSFVYLYLVNALRSLERRSRCNRPAEGRVSGGEARFWGRCLKNWREMKTVALKAFS